jgi:hypothetical protein
VAGEQRSGSGQILGPGPADGDLVALGEGQYVLAVRHPHAELRVELYEGTGAGELGRRERQMRALHGDGASGRVAQPHRRPLQHVLGRRGARVGRGIGADGAAAEELAQRER